MVRLGEVRSDPDRLARAGDRLPEVSLLGNEDAQVGQDVCVLRPRLEEFLAVLPRLRPVAPAGQQDGQVVARRPVIRRLLQGTPEAGHRFGQFALLLAGGADPAPKVGVGGVRVQRPPVQAFRPRGVLVLLWLPGLPQVLGAGDHGIRSPGTARRTYTQNPGRRTDPSTGNVRENWTALRRPAGHLQG
jgi:hypothetical protein